MISNFTDQNTALASDMQETLPNGTTPPPSPVSTTKRCAVLCVGGVVRAEYMFVGEDLSHARLVAVEAKHKELQALARERTESALSEVNDITDLCTELQVDRSHELKSDAERQLCSADPYVRSKLGVSRALLAQLNATKTKLHNIKAEREAQAKQHMVCRRVVCLPWHIALRQS